MTAELPDLLREALSRPGVWLVLVLDVVVALGAWRVGLGLLDFIRNRLPDPLERPLRVFWSLGVLYALVAVITSLLVLPIEPLLGHGAALSTWLRESAGRILLVLLLAVVAWNFVSTLAARVVPADEFNRRTVRVTTLKGVVESSARVAIVVVALVTILDNLGVRTGTLLAGVSVLGLAVSFGAQSLIKDVINGFFILLEDQYGVGDVVTVNGGTLSGGVERLNLRVTGLRALDGTLHLIPNGQINTVSVMSKDWSRVVASVNLPLTADPDEAIELLTRVSNDLHQDATWATKFLEPPTVEGVTNFTKDGFEVRALFKVLPKEQWGIGREFNRRMKLAMDGAGLGGLRPQLMVFRSEDGAPPTPPAPAASRDERRQLPDQ